MNLSELIKNKNSKDQARIESLRADRENLSEMRNAALTEVTSNPEMYQRYLDLQSGNISLSAGNVALTMIQLQVATKIGPTDYWHEQGRYVLDDAIKNGAKVFVTPKNSQRRGYLMGDYYDISQTSGKPMKEQVPLAENSPRMLKALESLMNYSPVPIVEDNEMAAPAYYDPEKLELSVNAHYSDLEVFAALSTEVTYARIHGKGRNMDFTREEYRLDAESVGYMLCRRFGVEQSAPHAAAVRQLYDGYEPADRSDALERLRKTAQNIGDGIERTIQPRQQEQSRKRYAAR